MIKKYISNLTQVSIYIWLGLLAISPLASAQPSNGNRERGVLEPDNCNGGGGNCLGSLPQVSANDTQLKNGLAIIFGVFAAVAVIVIIVAAINFATSDGEADKISRSKKTIIYALIGLVIALSAEAAVLTLLGRVAS